MSKLRPRRGVEGIQVNGQKNLLRKSMTKAQKRKRASGGHGGLLAVQGGD